jgi:glutamyl-tRNA reductase
MRPLQNESYEAWSERVTMFEKGRALQRIAQGESAEVVLEDMSRRIMEKLLHPIFKAIRESSVKDYDPVKSKEEYFEKMNYGSVADHVEGNLFDNSKEL